MRTVLNVYFVAVSALIILAATFGLPAWMQNGFVYFVAGVLFIGWVFVVLIYCMWLLGLDEKRPEAPKHRKTQRRKPRESCYRRS